MTTSPNAAVSFDWRIQAFDQLTAAELYAILQLRAAIFVVEQKCAYQDVDGKDSRSHHLTGWDGADLAAYARLLPPGVVFPEASIGRVATASRYRRAGLGRMLVARTIDVCARLYGAQPIQIGAQAHLKTFYAEFGFVPISSEYAEDGIPHLNMIRP